MFGNSIYRTTNYYFYLIFNYHSKKKISLEYYTEAVIAQEIYLKIMKALHFRGNLPTTRQPYDPGMNM